MQHLFSIMRRSLIPVSLVLGAALGGCIVEYDGDYEAYDDELDGAIGTETSAISGWSTAPIASLTRVRVAGQSDVHSGILIGNAGSSTLLLTSSNWVTWSSDPATLTAGIPAAGGTFHTRAGRYVNTNAYFPGAAVVQMNSVSSNQFQADTRSVSQLIGAFARCYEYVSDTRAQYVDIRFTGSSGDDVSFEYPWGGRLHNSDAGAPCIANGSTFVGFILSATATGGQMQSAASMKPWLDGMRNLASVRDHHASSQVAIYTRPNSSNRMCLDVPWGSPYAHSAVNQYPCHYGPAQRWWLDYRADSLYPRLVSDSGGLCIDLPGGSTASGQNLQIYPCHGGLNQRFDMSLWSGGGIKIRPRHVGSMSQCLSVQGGASTQSRPAEQRTCLYSPWSYSDQRWYLQFNPVYSP